MCFHLPQTDVRNATCYERLMWLDDVLRKKIIKKSHTCSVCWYYLPVSFPLFLRICLSIDAVSSGSSYGALCVRLIGDQCNGRDVEENNRGLL